MSFKKLGTMNQLAYCSSMKTIKSLKYSDACISISSKNMISEKDIADKKLIKIANRKVYEELVKDTQGEAVKNRKSKSKSRLKIKKEGKVRFDQTG